MENFKSFFLDIRDYGYLSQKDKYGVEYAETKGYDYVEAVCLVIYINLVLIITILIPFLINFSIPKYIVLQIKSNIILFLILSLLIFIPYFFFIGLYIKPLLKNKPIDTNTENYNRKRNKFWTSFFLGIIFPFLMFSILNVLKFGKINP